MSSAIGHLHQALAWMTGTGLALVSWTPALVQLVLVSVVAGVVMVLIHGKLSNQTALKRVKTDISAALMEVFLFRRDTLQALKAQGALLSAGCRYFFLAMGPVLILAVPFAIALGHLNVRFGARPLGQSENAVLSVNVAKGTELRKVALVADPGLTVEGPVRVPKIGSLHWRVRPTSDGQHSLKVVVPGVDKVIEQSIQSGQAEAAPLGIYLSRHELLTSLFFPNGGGGFSLPPGPVERVQLSYPERTYALGGMEFSWVSVFLVVSIAAGLVGSRLFGISV